MKKKIIAFTITIAVFFAGCANPGVPTGGDKDETPPVVTKTTPENHSVGFDSKKIVIDFNEFVQLKDIAKNVNISPPQKKTPKIRLKEKRIEVLLRDSVRPNTTYSIDFGNAIVDNNEGNPLGEYRYVFSTGNKIDSMGLAGYVKGSVIDTVAPNVKVALFMPSDTLNPYKRLPDYLTQTDSIGFFMFTNISDRAYNIIAFSDENNNNMLDEEEKLAFQKSTVHTSFPTETKNDKDTIQFDKYTLFKNIDLRLHMFPPIPEKQYLKDYNRAEREKFIFRFNAPLKDSLQVKLLETEEKPRFFVEQNSRRDSLVYWILSPNLQKKDTLFAELSYLKTDSLGQLVPTLDTLKLLYKEPKKKGKKEKEEKKTDFMKVITNVANKINYFDTLTLNFERPVLDFKSDYVQVFQKKDTIEVAQKFTLEPDKKLPLRKFHVLLPLKAGSPSYKMKIDSMKVFDISGRPNALFETSFATYEEEYYGKLFVTVIGGDDTILLQVVKKGQPNAVVAEQRWSGKGEFIFDKLPPATYNLKLLWDRNKNGKWDTGDYKKQELPELGKMFKKDIELNSNWELEVSWTLNKKDDDKTKK